MKLLLENVWIAPGVERVQVCGFERPDWIIYGLVDPITGNVRYVGKTAQSPEERLKGHLAGSIRKNHHLGCWLRKLRRAGLTPIMCMLKHGWGEGWEQEERKWINGPWARVLTNTAEGGEGLTSVGFRRIWDRIPTERRSEIARKRRMALSPERRSAICRKPMAVVIARLVDADSIDEKTKADRRAAALATKKARGTNRKPKYQLISDVAKQRCSDPIYAAKHFQPQEMQRRIMARWAGRAAPPQDAPAIIIEAVANGLTRPRIAQALGVGKGKLRDWLRSPEHGPALRAAFLEGWTLYQTR